MLFAQIALAKQGYSTGGRPPYGFRLWLVTVDGTKIRQLRDGERVRMARHPVVWLPGPEADLQIIRRILTMLETMPASRVAAILTAEGIPSPDAGRNRVDNGIRHQVGGAWHATTITNIARNRLLIAVATYGRRSMGDQLRLSAKGPRKLTGEDYRADDKPKAVANDSSQHVTASAHFEPVISKESHDRIVAILDNRGGSQRGKPRSRDPNQNPLGGRIFDIGCTWPMYRTPYNGSFRYVCGCYMQSHGALCSHNTIDGPLAVRFVRSCIGQRMFALESKLEARLRQLADRDSADDRLATEVQLLEERLSAIEQDLNLAKTNLARAENEEQFKAIASRFDELANQEKGLEKELNAARKNNQFRDTESEVAAAMEAARRLGDLPSGGQDNSAATRLFGLANATLYLKFKKKLLTKRAVNRIESGVLTLGNAPAPINVYQGDTARYKLMDLVACGATDCSNHDECVSIGSGEGGNSLGNVNRGDWTPIELFRRLVANLGARERQLLRSPMPQLDAFG